MAEKKKPITKVAEQSAVTKGKNTVLKTKKFPIVGIGASAGGFEAFEAFFKAMPADSGMAFILVSHLSPTHVSILPELVQKLTEMKVFQIEDDMVVRPNTVYVIPPNNDLAILNGVLQLMEPKKKHEVNLPIDTFLRSLARDQGENAICLIFSGTGTDGTLGLKAIKGETGMAMVQDEESAKYDGMPRSAIATGLADYVLPPDKMPEQLIKYTKHAIHEPAARLAVADGKIQAALQKIYVLLRAHTDHDFSHYKKNTIIRRIERRMQVHQVEDISHYIRYLRENEREVRTLFKELLIGVTNFFRDPEAFDTLKENILPELFQQKPDNYTIRVWIPGCSTGEEAYSVAIVLQECMEDLKRFFNIQIFGTDIDEEAVNVARAGLYSASISADVTPARLKRFFIKEDNQYRIKQQIREMLVFAPQNMVKDPPFTKLDLICCRNLLIYLDQELQRKLLPIFHYSLKPEGILFLGSSETVGPATDLFATLDRKWKIYKRKPSDHAVHPVLGYPAPAQPYLAAENEIPAAVKKVEEISALQLVGTILQQSNTPPCAIIDEKNNILYLHGRTGKYLEPASGKISVNIVEMARPGLKRELTSAIRNANRLKREVALKNVRIQTNGGYAQINLTVRPILEQSALRGLLMIMFEEAAPATRATKVKAKRVAAIKKTRDVAQLEQDLQYTRESLQTTIEELETSNEELKSTNEELQSTNEELQSTNEELETSKEELQSLNEESVTVNAELQGRIENLSQANDDMKNLLDSTEVATIFLDIDLRIRRFTPSVTEIIPLAGIDIGRPLKLFAVNLINVDLVHYAEEVLKDLGVLEKEVRSKDGNFFTIRVRPYRTVSNVIDGVVFTFDEITERKRIENALQETMRFSESIVETVRVPLVVLDDTKKIILVNRFFCQTFNVKKKETEGKNFYELGNRQWDIKELRRLLDDVLVHNTTVEGFEVEHEFPEIGRRKMLVNGRRLYSEIKKRDQILLALEDITGK